MKQIVQVLAAVFFGIFSQASLATDYDVPTSGQATIDSIEINTTNEIVRVKLNGASLGLY